MKRIWEASGENDRNQEAESRGRSEKNAQWGDLLVFILHKTLLQCSNQGKMDTAYSTDSNNKKSLQHFSFEFWKEATIYEKEGLVAG
jgi:hypothetical protein